jgi:hypothetical protein
VFPLVRFSFSRLRRPFSILYHRFLLKCVRPMGSAVSRLVPESYSLCLMGNGNSVARTRNRQISTWCQEWKYMVLYLQSSIRLYSRPDALLDIKTRPLFPLLGFEMSLWNW